MDKVYTIPELKTILSPVFAEHGVKRAVLFGSYAKGVATPLSDVDLVVDSGLRGLAFFGLLECGYSVGYAGGPNRCLPDRARLQDRQGSCAEWGEDL